MMILLIEKGADYNDIGILSIIVIPISLKFLVAPILDVYYFDWAGKRKTYIISTIFIIGLINLYLGSRINGLIETLDIKFLFSYGLTITILLSLMGIGIDGWLVLILDTNYYGLGAST